MIAYIKGKITDKNPTHVIIETSDGIGYHVNISLNTYDKILGKTDVRLHTHLSIKEDAHTLYGFFDEHEKEVFRMLIGISGVGPSLSRMVLSSLEPNELRDAIINGDVALLKSVKGIGAKSAQRIIIELQGGMEKLSLEGAKSSDVNLQSQKQESVEAQSALVALGFRKNEAEKAINKVLKTRKEQLSVEDLIKFALKNL